MRNLIEDIKQDMIDKLESEVGLDSNIHDLHHELCNTDYFIIGTYKASKWLGNDTFEAIEKIKEYEQFNFGEVYTDFSNPEQICNMLAYIVGEELLSQCRAYNDCFQLDETIRQHDINMIIQQLNNIDSYRLVA